MTIKRMRNVQRKYNGQNDENQETQNETCQLIDLLALVR